MTTYMVIYISTHSVTRLLSPLSPLGSSIVSETVAYITTQTTTYTTTYILPPPATESATATTTNTVAEPILQADDPRAIFQQYKEVREAWFAILPHRVYKTNQQYQKTMGLPLRYSKAEYDWCLNYKQMGVVAGQEIISETGLRRR